jgi:hypothetical protein
LKQQVLGWLTWIVTILGFLLLVVLGEWLPWMPAIQHFQETHPLINQSLIGVTLAMTIVGGLLLVFTQFLVRVPDASGALDAPVIKTKGVVKGPGRIFSGTSIHTGFSDTARMWRVKQAFRDGEWWRNPRWRRMSLMMLGAILLFYGLFGLLFLIFSPGIKFILIFMVLYATVRTVYAFAVDKPSRLGGDDPG